jgi:hypothetical protein
MRFSRFVLGPAVVGLVAVAVSACSGPSSPPSSTNGTDNPSSGGGTPSTSESRSSQIADPLNTDALVKNPCGALIDAQLTPYMGAVRKKQPQASGNGQQCVLFPASDDQPTITSSVLIVTGGSQDNLYASASSFAYRKRIDPIDGYPSLSASLLPNGPSRGECQVEAAVANERTIVVDFDASSAQSSAHFADPCGAAHALVEQIIQNIKAGGS